MKVIFLTSLILILNILGIYLSRVRLTFYIKEYLKSLNNLKDLKHLNSDEKVKILNLISEKGTLFLSRLLLYLIPYTLVFFLLSIYQYGLFLKIIIPMLAYLSMFFVSKK